MCGRGGVVEVEAEFSFDADAVVGRVGGVAEGILAGLKVFEGGDGGADGDVLARVVVGERFAVVGLEVEGSDFVGFDDFVGDDEVAPGGPITLFLVELLFSTDHYVGKLLVGDGPLLQVVRSANSGPYTLLNVIGEVCK